jgi:hypothetical protein
MLVTDAALEYVGQRQIVRKESRFEKTLWNTKKLNEVYPEFI